MKRRVMTLVVAVGVLLGTRATEAAPITINIGDFSGGTAQLHAPGTLANNLYVYLGGVWITGDLGSFWSYCVDLQHYDIPGNNLALVDTMDHWNNVATPSPVATTLGGGAASWLYTQYAGVAAGNQTKQAALSLAIWNSLYDKDYTVLGGAGFWATGLSNAAFGTQADAWLTNLKLFTDGGGILPTATWLRTIDLGSNTAQDFIAPAPVPEPGTLLLMGTGMAGLAGLRRRRNRRATAN